MRAVGAVGRQATPFWCHSPYSHLLLTAAPGDWNPGRPTPLIRDELEEATPKLGIGW